MDFEYGLTRSAAALLDYMAVRSGESILLTADHSTDRRVLGALMAAAHNLHARPSVLLSAKLPFQGLLADPYVSPLQMAAFGSCDVWIDLAFPYFAGCHAHDSVIKRDQARYLLAADMDAGAMDRLFGQVSLDELHVAQRKYESVFAVAKGLRCRIVCPHGTDVEFILGTPRPPKSRRADKPGMYLVPGQFSIPYDIASVTGSVVVVAGFHEYYEHLQSAVTLKVDGKILSVSGGGSSRAPLERALRRAGDGSYGSIIHFTQGLHPAARATGKCFIEDIRTMGSNAVGLGVPWWVPGGGENHPDTVLFEQTISIDGHTIIQDGEMLGDGPLAEAVSRFARKPQISERQL